MEYFLDAERSDQDLGTLLEENGWVLALDPENPADPDGLPYVRPEKNDLSTAYVFDGFGIVDVKGYPTQETRETLDEGVKDEELFPDEEKEPVPVYGTDTYSIGPK